MQRPKRWNIPDPHPAADDLARQLAVSPILAQVLLNRGLSDPGDCLSFLRPKLSALHQPAALANVPAAAERIAKAIRDKEKIVIYGDYDVDGITATAILWHAITLYDGVVDFYIPHRIDEGYGLNAEAIDQICAAGAKLIVTVDCGITARDPAAVARAHGVDLIITDHHEWDEHRIEDSGLRTEPESADDLPAQPSVLSPQSFLPPCHAIVHPHLPGADGGAYPNRHLCGAGVAFKLAWGVGQAMSGSARVDDRFRNYLVEATALAALGTIADVVPLVGENRVLAHAGLGGLKQTRLVGLLALIESAGLTGQKLDSYDVGFKLGPRLNACGRMGHARLAVEMLTRADAAKATEIANYLEDQNRQRQTLEKRIVEQAMAQVEEQGYDGDGCRGVVVAAEGWHAGVIGIVASRLVEKLCRPVVMIALSNGSGQGSGRSVAGFHLTRALGACREHLVSFGGHEMAAGLKLSTEKLPQFREAFARHCDDAVSREMMTATVHLEAAAELRQISAALVTDLHRLGPFGHANRRPLLCCRGLEVAAPPRRVGQAGQHLQLMVRQGQTQMKCIAFGYGEHEANLPPGTRVDLAVEPSINEYQGRSSVELQVKDMQYGGKT